MARTPEGEAGARGPGRPSGKTGRGVGQARLLALAASLSARDQQVLALLHEHRFLTTPHLYVLLFEEKHANEGTGMRVCRRVLARLHQHRLIDQLPRRVGGYGAGSAAGVWFLTTTGQRLLSLTLGDGAALSAARVRDPSTRFVAHTLAVADTHVRLHKAARARRFGLSRVQTEPDCWRPYLGLHGARETLKPDLAMTTVSGDGQYEDSWFIEVDLGTEHLPTVLGKCGQYEAYRRTGAEQAKRGVFPLVVWMTTASARADKLRGAIRKTSGLDAALFRITTPDGLTDLIARGAA
ncbi:MAG: replication-relaxation family protein [Actinomycetales bacterium]|uniref:Replication-relaxation family protein n=1 Tax=Candidatus Phosphoribacter hodrii TaxID=2953743 RepID=A0A9D7T9Q3_9MICO|nr:replication-relaxation family protein [Candidatus Phosphoribacter hodrii]